MVKFTTILVSLLGLFEVFATISLLVESDQAILAKHKLFPPIFLSNPSVKSLLIVYTITLGFARLTWVTSTYSILSWIFLIGTHTAECLWLWNLALSPHFNKGRLNLPDFIKALVTGKAPGNNFSKFVLIFIPCVVVFFTFCALAQIFSKNTSTQKRKD